MEAATYGGLNLFFQPISTYFLFTGILITSTGIFNKNPTGTGCDPPPRPFTTLVEVKVLTENLT